jgi:DNA-binding NarL/FixJ family response regulator
VRVALADDAAVLREGLARVLADAGIEVTVEGRDPPTDVAPTTKEGPP